MGKMCEGTAFCMHLNASVWTFNPKSREVSRDRELVYYIEGALSV